MFVRLSGLVIFHILFIGTLSTATAQQYPYNVDTKPPRGFLPTSDQLLSPIDSVDPVDGKLHVQISLGSLPPGPAGTGFDVELVYDSHLYDLYVHEIQPLYDNPPPVVVQELQAAGSTGGWTYNFQNFRLEGETRFDLDSQCPTNGPLRVHRYRVGLPDGSQHILHLKGYSDELPSDQYDGEGWFGIQADGKPPMAGSSPTPLQCWTNAGWLASGRLTYFTTDGSYLKLEIETTPNVYWWNKTWTLYFPDGRRAQGKGSKIDALYDANSNKIVFENMCADPLCWQPMTRIYHEQDAAQWRDARKVLLAFNTTAANPNDPNVTARTDTVTGPGPNGPVTSTIHWQRLVIGNDGRNYHWGGAPQQELTRLAMVHWVVGDIQLPPAGTLPSSLNYQFTYSTNTPAPAGYGELRSMSTPSGATYTYAYRFDGATCVDAAHCPTSVDLANYNWITQRRITGSDISTLTWNYEYDHTTYFKSTVHNPDGGDVVHWFTSPAGWGGVKLVNRIDEPHGSVRKRVWAQNKAYPLIGIDINNPNNPYIQRELVTSGNAANDPTSTAVTDFVYDKNGNLLSKTEYDWIGYPSENPQTVRRRTISNYLVNVGQASATGNDVNAYWREHNPTLWSDPTSTRRLNAVRRRDVWDGAIIAAATEFEYDAPYTKGNVKKEYQWDSAKSVVTNPLTNGNSVVFERSYDTSGNVIEIFEPAVRTHIEYDYGIVPKYVYYAYQTPAQRRWEYTWNTSGPVIIGTVLTTKIDLDNGITTSYTYDNLGRQRTLTEGTNLRRTATTYDDASRKITVMRDLVALGDGKLQTISYYDQLGRVKTAQQSDGTPLSGPADGIKVTTTYIAPVGVGRSVIMSSPYRSTNDPTLEWTCTQYDRLDRVTAVAMFTGTAPPSDCGSLTNRTGVATTNYNATWTTVTDPASKVRNLRRDALGRTDQVLEYPSMGVTYITEYAYDVLDNLTKVCQNGTIANGCIGGQARTFLYSSLSRLRSAANPEANNIAAAYTYFDSGDLKTRTDPRGVVTTFEYDELHRLRSKTYSSDPQATPKAAYTYYVAGNDAPPNIGQLKSVTASSATTPSTTIASTQYAYDLLGRISATTQTIDGYPGPLSLTYTYRLNDGLATVGYPSGHVVNYSVDDAGRPVRVYTSAKIYADLTPIIPADKRYTPDGRLARMWLGNDLWETRDYRTPSATTTLNVGTTEGSNNILGLEYNYHPTQNNGNLRSHGIVQPGRIWKQSYEYDGVNRLKCAAEALTTSPNDPCVQGTWRQTFGYDAYGNRWVAATIGLTGVDPHEPIAQSNFDAATNRLYVNNSGYDVAGNQTRYEPWNLLYDAENRIKSLVTTPNASVGNGSYAYDADGRRVKKAWTVGTATQTTYYLYNAFGQLAAEYSTQPAVSTSTTYIHTDLLGSIRMVTGEKPSNGTAPVLECYDYVPFGRMLNSSDDARNTGCYPASPDTQIASRLAEKFTGKQRDSETRLDYFGARYFSAAQGRFMSPDWSEIPKPVPYADLNQPQTLNLYAYVGNNPLVRADADGHCWPWCTAGFGAVIGGGTGIASELIAARISHRQVSWNDVKGAFLKGAVTGAVAGVVGPQAAGLGLGLQALAVGEANVVGGLIGRGIREQSLDEVFSPSAAIIDFASGAAGVKLGSVARAAGTKLAQRSAEVAAASGDQESVKFLTGNAKLAGELTSRAESLAKSTAEKVAKSKLRERDKQNCSVTGTCDPE